MLIRPLAASVLVAGLMACSSGTDSLAGYVIDMKSTSITQVDSFTLRTPERSEIVFQVGRLELDGDAFPAGHLREHMALGQPVAVAYREQDGNKIAYRLVDAPWLQPAVSPG